MSRFQLSGVQIQACYRLHPMSLNGFICEVNFKGSSGLECLSCLEQAASRSSHVSIMLISTISVYVTIAAVSSDIQDCFSFFFLFTPTPYLLCRQRSSFHKLLAPPPLRTATTSRARRRMEAHFRKMRLEQKENRRRARHFPMELLLAFTDIPFVTYDR